MKWWRRLRIRLRAARRKRAALKNNTPLREFVYLDEVSVYSLIASKLGAIATEFTDSETRSLTSEASGSISANTGVMKSRVGSKVASSESRGSQVLRKSIVQTTFKELYELESENFKASPFVGEIPTHAKSPLATTRLDEFDSPWVISASQLARGDLVEFEVSLGAEPIFTNSAVVSTMMHLMETNPLLADAMRAGDRVQMEAVAQILEQLLTGLVPIRASATQYSVINVHGDDYVLHHDLSRLLSPEDQDHLRPLRIVGVADESLFWKDIRRVLFSNSEFRVLGRISRSGIQEAWTPVKLAHVLESVLPGVRAPLEVFNQPVSGPAAIESADETPIIPAIESALQNYASGLAAAIGRELPAGLDLHDLALTADDDVMRSVEGRRSLFGALSDRLSTAWETTIEPAIAAKLRTQAIEAAGFDLQGNYSVEEPRGVTTEPADAVSRAAFLDVEFIAIYW